MSRFQAEPDLPLRPYIHSYWSLARDLSETGAFTITPDRFLELIFFVDPPWIEDAAGPRPLPVCTLIPLLGEPLRIRADGMVRCAAVRMHAWTAGLLFPQADAPAHAWFDMTALFGDQVPAVCDALRGEARRKIIELLDRAMRRTLAGARPAFGALAAARSFVVSPGHAAGKKTDVVAAEQGRSRRQVERQVRALTHHSPKQLTSLVRFQFVRDTLWAQPTVELARLAFDAGYADQAHLTRHFHRYSGRSPGEFIRESLRLKASLRREEGDVAFLQDDGSQG